MQCPDCGYMMSAFDKECVRCAKFQADGKKPPAGLGPMSEHDKQFIVEPPQDASPAATPPTLPAAEQPADLSEPELIRRMQLIERQHHGYTALSANLITYWPFILAVCVFFFFGAFLFHGSTSATGNQSGFSAGDDEQNIVSAAKDGACSNLGQYGPIDQKGIDACKSRLDTMTYTIDHEADNHVKVIFFSNGNAFLDDELFKDSAGQWNSVR